MKLLSVALMEVVECLLFPDITGWNNFTLVEEPFLPTVKELDHMEAPESAARWHVWTLIMLGIALVVAVAGTLILKCAERGPGRPGGEYATVKVASRVVSLAEEEDRKVDRSAVTMSFQPRTLKVFLAISLMITFSTSFAVLAWSSRTGRLSKDYGADWEVYTGLLACSGLALVLQALIMARRLPPGEKFGATAFAQACITGMAPVLSDQYDTFKDVMFGILCMESEHVEIQVMGVFSLLWLVGVHVVCFAFEDTTAELLASHLSVLLLTPDTGAEVSFRDELLVLLYKQLTPTKRRLLLLENVPQAICAIIFIRYEGGSIVVTVLSLAIPTLQIALAFLLFGTVRAQVAPFFGRRLRALLRAGDQLLAQRLWREADFEFDKGLFRQAVAFMHRKEIGVERDDDLIRLWKVALAMHHGLSEEEQWDLSDLGLKEELFLVEAFFAELAASECQKLDVNLSKNQLGDAGVRSLATGVSSLKKQQDLSLNLEMCDLDAAGAAALAGALGRLVELQKLTLNLKGNKICEEGALSLLEALRAIRPASTQLDLSDIGKGAVALARAVRSGEVNGCVTHAVVEMLLREGFEDEEAGKLQLELSSKEDFGVLCRALPLLSLQDIQLRLALELGEEGALSLLEALRAIRPASTQLDLSDMGDSDIGKGAVALARAFRSGEVKGHVAHPLVEFLLELEDQTFRELAEDRKLNITFHSPPAFEKLFQPLCRTLGWLGETGAQLQELELKLGWNSRFGAGETRDLARGLQRQTELKRLKLWLHDNPLGDEGAEAVASALLELKELETLELHLHNSNIGPEGATAVAEALRALWQLAELEVRLEKNRIGDKEEKKLRAVLNALPAVEKTLVL